MAEGIIGVAASAITLAALFSSCIDCFSYFKAAQNCPREAESLLVKLDCEKARLLVWANTVGILQTDRQKRDSKLADVRHESLIRRCIEQIMSLLTDAQKLQHEYGSRATTEHEGQRYLAVLSVNSMNLFQSAKRTFFARTGTKNAKPTMFSRIKWAIRDAAKFRFLIVNLREYVDNLIQLVPVAPEVISSIIEEDIVSTINISSLRLIENGCDESSYPQWSARATESIRDSDIGTVDRRNLSEILGDSELMHEDNVPSQQPQTISEAKYSNIPFHNTFLILTEKCLNLEAGADGPCTESRIGGAISERYNKTQFTSSGMWSLGRRLLDHLSLSYDCKEKLQQNETFRLEHARISSDILEVEKISRLLVYCGACACAISTAQMLVTDKDIPEHMEIVIRVDDRITTSCRGRASIPGVLETVRDVLEDFDAGHGASNKQLSSLDSPALERRLYAIEQERDQRVESRAILQDFMLQEQSYMSTDRVYTAGIVVIIENDTCSESLNHTPFLAQSRKPRAGEMYRFQQAYAQQKPGYIPYTISFIGRFNRSKTWLDRDRSHKDASNLLEEDANFSQSNISSSSRKRARSSSTTD